MTARNIFMKQPRGAYGSVDITVSIFSGKEKYLQKQCHLICEVYFEYVFMSMQCIFSWPGQLSRYSDLLRNGGSGDRIAVGARCSPPIQTNPVTHPASHRLGNGYYFQD